eukprot:Pgem_evm1s8273
MNTFLFATLGASLLTSHQVSASTFQIFTKGQQSCTAACSAAGSVCNLSGLYEIATPEKCRAAITALGGITKKRIYEYFDDDHSGCAYHPHGGGWYQIFLKDKSISCEQVNGDKSRQRVCVCGTRSSSNTGTLTDNDKNVNNVYNLVDPKPYCQRISGLCAESSNKGYYNSAATSNLRERQMFAIHNMARVGPEWFRGYYGGFEYGCSVPSSNTPAEWESNLNQAAKKQAQMCADGTNGCQSGHSTCPFYANKLFGGNTGFEHRVKTFNTYANAEILTPNGYTAYQAMKLWFTSKSGHCNVIFNSPYSRAGYGHVYGNGMAIGNFNNKPHQHTTNFVKSGAHFKSGNLFGYRIPANHVHFMANYYSAAGVHVKTAEVVLDNISHTLTRRTGNAPWVNGGYNADVALTTTNDCPKYYFKFIDKKEVQHRLPQTGYFIIDNG